MYAKVRISGDIEVKTGMHIGGSSAFSAIGAVDSPVILDVRSNLPMIPGSSLKGKMRSLLAKEFNEAIVEPDNDHERLTRLFGSAKKDNVKRSMTEVKFENSINRTTAIANPRQIERVVRGSVFRLDLIYELENMDEFLEDMETLGEGMKLMQYDYLGGSGSRGYGKIRFEALEADVVVGQVDDDAMTKCREILTKAVEI